MGQLSFSGTEEQEECRTPACLQFVQELASTMDKTARPCDDFYQFACGAGAETEDNLHFLDVAFTNFYLRMYDMLRNVSEANTEPWEAKLRFFKKNKRKISNTKPWEQKLRFF